MNHSGITAYVLVGPTGVGKTGVAQILAEEGPFDIVSADSMLIYKGMDIGTAKPSLRDRSRVRYWCIDAIRPDEAFSAGAFRALAEQAFKQISEKGRQAIVVGGTGLYVKSLTNGLEALPASDPLRRAYWERALEDGGIEKLAAALRENDPAGFESLKDKQNPRRLIRALLLAETLAEAHAPGASRTWEAPVVAPPITGLLRPMDELKQRIELRVIEMYRAGLLQEVESLLCTVPALGPTASQAIGYREAIACLRGECSEAEAVSKTIIRTRQFAKRQLTWFRHQANVKWVHADASMRDIVIAHAVREQWRQSGPVPMRLIGS